MAENSLQRAMRVHGWMNANELALLHAIALTIPPGGRVAEVGSWKGRSTVAICEGLAGTPDVRLYAVDTFAGDMWIEGLMGEIGDGQADAVYREFLQNTAPYGFVETIRAQSTDAPEAFADEFFDWIFIDADHSFDAVLADIRAWYPKLKPGGLLNGHDYWNRDVSSAVHTLFRRVGVWETIWHTRRNRGDLRFRPVPFARGRALRAVRRRPRLLAASRRIRDRLARRNG